MVAVPLVEELLVLELELELQLGPHAVIASVTHLASQLVLQQ
jgi:hypothetical protein